MEVLETQQILHRFGDMQRIMNRLAAKRSLSPQEREQVRLFAQVDYTHPLIPQIGFDPDTW